MIDSHGKVRRAAGELVRLLGVVAECPTCNAVATCHAETLAASVTRLRMLLLPAWGECRNCGALANPMTEKEVMSPCAAGDGLHSWELKISSPTELRRAAASLLWYLREVQSCCVCAAEEGCHKAAVDKAAESLQAELQPKKGGRR